MSSLKFRSTSPSASSPKLFSNKDVEFQPLLEDISQQQEDLVQNNSTQSKTFTSFSPETAAILTVYFVQGALGLSRLALTYFLKDDFHLSPAEVSALAGLSTLPWVIKPLYGFLSDGFPIFGYKRRSYLVVAGLIGCLSWLALGTIVHDLPSAVAANILGSLSIAVSDVVVDSIVVEKQRGGSGGELQSLCWGSAATGGLLSAYFSGSLLEILKPSSIFCITALFPLLISLSSLFINEDRSVGEVSIASFGKQLNTQFTQLKSTILTPAIYLPVLFIFLWQATPAPDSAMFFFNTGELGFKPEFLGRVRLASSIASLIGVAVFRTYLKDTKIKDVIFWATLISVPLGLTQVLLTTHLNRAIGIPDQAFALTDTVVLTVLGQVAFMPTLVLAASLCPPGVEGTLFATLMSIYNAAGSVSSELGAGLTYALGISETNFDNLSLLIIICSLSSLVPLPFIGLLDQKKSVESISKSSIEINDEEENSKIL